MDVPSTRRFFNRIVSAVAFLLVVAASMGIAYGFATAQYEAEKKENGSILGTSFLVSAGIAGTNMALAYAAQYLTYFEYRTTYTALQQHNALKLIILKVLNVWMFMLSKFIVRNENDDNDLDVCYLEKVGNQYLSLILLELTVSNFIEVGLPVIWFQISKSYSHGSDLDAKAEFDVSLEYLELLYRQYIVYVAFNSFPMVAVLAVVTNILEIIIDRYRLIRLMRTSGRIKEHKIQLLISGLMLFIAVAGLLSFPSGSAYTISVDAKDGSTMWRACAVMYK